MSQHVKIPTYTSAFRKGERTGTIVKTGWLNNLGRDKRGRLEMARVKLDKSGDTILVAMGDCQIIGEYHG